jgi:hypothetical protein
VKLAEIKELFELREQYAKDPELAKEVNKAVTHWLGLPAVEHQRRATATNVILGVFLFFAIITFILNVAATLRWVDVDDKFLGRSWTAFIVEMVPLVGYTLKNLFGKSE